MWRSRERRKQSAQRRLEMAGRLWGWSPHPAQERLFAATAQVRVAACGRRWGKTECLAADLTTLLLECVADGIPCRQLIAAPTEAQALLIGSECRRLLEAASRSPHLDAEWSLSSRKNPGLDLAIGDSQLLFRTGGRDGRALRGLSAHRIVVDEAAYAPDELIYDALLPMLADAGGELTLASSPAGRRGAFYRFFAHAQNAAEGDELLLPHGASGGSLTFFCQQCPSTDNPHLDRDWLAAMMEEAGERRYAQEFLAQFLEDGDAVFREEDIAACIEADPRVFWEGDDLLSLPDPERLYALGIDWGRKVDFTAAALIDGSERPARLVGLWRRRGMSWDAQRRWLADLAARYQPVRILCDSTSVGDPATEALRAAIWERRDAEVVGGRCPDPEPFCFTPAGKTALIDRLGIALSARALRFPRHPVLLSELQAFQYGSPGPSGRRPMAASGSGHDDTVCALALAWRATPTGAGLDSGAGVQVGSSL